jgi:hypothetical protein
VGSSPWGMPGGRPRGYRESMDTYHGLRAWFRARPPWVLDGVIALVVSLVPLWVLAGVPPETPGMHGYDGMTPGLVALTLLTGVPLLWRRTLARPHLLIPRREAEITAAGDAARDPAA